MLGGGNPVGGANPSGTGSVLNFVGEHAYLYTGFSQVNNVRTTIAKFSTGNLYIVGTFQPQMDTDTATDNYRYRLLINGEVIISVQTTSATDYSPYEDVEILIPPNSEMEITAENETDNTANDVGAIVIGRVYR
jgi:hypothetical protein|tara:strand:+ start:279 stop:680 length:402 start_codon:yes stop_codon:yes gene_type:complete